MDAVNEIRESLGVIRGAQKESLEKAAANEAAMAKLADELKALKDRGESTEKWINEIEQRMSKARHGNGSNRIESGDALRDVISPEFRGHIHRFVADGMSVEDATKQAAANEWCAKAARMQVGGKYAGKSAEYAEQLEKLERGFGVERAAMQEDTGSEGGFTVPTPLEAEILRAVADNAVVRPRVRTVMMSAKTLDWPSAANAVTAAIIAEEGTITESNETFAQKQLVAKKFAAIGTASMELLSDAAVDIWSHYRTLAAEQIALLEDDEALEGDGTNFTGINAASGTNSVAAAGDNTTISDELGIAKFKGPQASRRNGSWTFHSQTIGHLVGMSDSNGKPLLNTSDVGRLIDAGFGSGAAPNGLVGTILGQPVYESDQITLTAASPDTANAYYGNYRDGLIYGDRSGIELLVSAHTKFTTAQLQIRIIKRTGILVAVPAYFTKYTAVPSEN